MPIATEYKPVVRAKRGDFLGATLVGSNSAIIAWNVDTTNGKLPKDLMGFAVRRTDFEPESEEIFRMRWLNGLKGFRDGDHGQEVRSDQAPFQRFRWSDYSLDPSLSYRYEVFPMIGRPGDLERGDHLTFNVRPSQPVVDGVGFYANRGVTAAMAYLRRFQGMHPDDVPGGAAYRWLERGLKESLLGFIASARSGEALHVCIYEFFLEEIAHALREAKLRGVEIAIVYHAKAGDHATEKNERVIAEGKLKGVSTPRTHQGNISHNKFVVLLDKQRNANKLWTASANISTNAFYFQTNVALTFDSPDLSSAYESYFRLLERDPVRGRKKRGSTFARDEVAALNDEIDADSPAEVSKVLFSPIRGLHVLDAANDLISRAESAMFLSAPFGVGQELITAIEANDADILEYGLANATAKKKIAGLRKRNTRFFTPSRLKMHRGEPWDAKAFGAHKIHAKTMVIDPWGKKPALLIGSANFSKPSCQRNDENTLLIEGDHRLAAMVATEFLRMYDHYKIRYWINRANDPNSTATFFLNDEPSWANIYFRKSNRSRKFRDREVFSGLK